MFQQHIPNAVTQIITSEKMAKFLWKKSGPKPQSKKNLDEPYWMLATSITTANNLEVNIKAGSREFGLSSTADDYKISELSLKKRYA